MVPNYYFLIYCFTIILLFQFNKLIFEPYPEKKLSAPRNSVTIASQPSNFNNIRHNQSSIMNFVHSKKPITILRSKQIDEQVAKMIVKG